MNRAEKKIDWEQVHERLRKSQLALEQALSASPERREAVYRERAAQLARRRTQADAPGKAVRVLTFTLGTERYGLELADLKEMLPFACCAAVPGGPPQLLGVMNVHGEIRSVIDLARLLDIPSADGPVTGYVLRVSKGGREGVLRVDALDKIQLVPRGELALPDEREDGAFLNFLQGLTPDRLRLLHTDALLRHTLFTGR